MYFLIVGNSQTFTFFWWVIISSAASMQIIPEQLVPNK